MKQFLLTMVLVGAGLKAFSQGQQTMVPMTNEQLMQWMRFQQGSGAGAAGGLGGVGCFQTMLDNSSQSITTSLQARTQQTNTLLGLSQQYFEQEQKCGNDLAEAVVELNNAKAEHQEKLMQLPAQIELQRLEYEETVLAIQQECEATSGENWVKWKQAVGTGVITGDDGGFSELVDRQQSINRYQKLFYDDCISTKNNIKRADILAKKMAANINILQAGLDASAMKLATLTENLIFNQRETKRNCDRAIKQLDYQAELAKNNAAAANTAAKKQNFLRMLSGVGVCLMGPNGDPVKSVDSTNSKTQN